MEGIIQNVGKGFTIRYDMYRDFDSIVQSGVEFVANNPMASLSTIDPG